MHKIATPTYDFSGNRVIFVNAAIMAETYIQHFRHLLKVSDTAQHSISEVTCIHKLSACSTVAPDFYCCMT